MTKLQTVSDIPNHAFNQCNVSLHDGYVLPDYKYHLKDSHNHYAKDKIESSLLVHESNDSIYFERVAI